MSSERKGVGDSNPSKSRRKLRFSNDHKYQIYKSEDLKSFLSRHQYWIKWIVPMRKDRKLGLLEFAVSTVNVLTREKQVVIVNIEDCGKTKMTQEPNIELISEENTISIFATKRTKMDEDKEIEVPII